MALIIDDRAVLTPNKFSKICSTCKHLDVQRVVRGDGHGCTAYTTKEIPDEIWEGHDDHSEPRDDQDTPGIVYERDPRVAPPKKKR